MADDRDEHGELHTLGVRRTARFHTSAPPDGPWTSLWYVLHGYAQLAPAFGRACRALAEPGHLVVAPEGLSRFYPEGGSGAVGASWMTREERAAEIDDTLAYLGALDARLRRGDRATAPVAVLGFSQGAAAAARLVVLGGLDARRLVLWGAGFPPDLDVEHARARLEGVDVVLVAGRSDPHLDDARLERELVRLRAVAPAARLERFEGGHRLQRRLLRTLSEF